MKVQLVLILLLVAIWQAAAHRHYTCQFDQLNRDLREESRKAKPDISSVQPGPGRILQTITRNPIRITTDSSSFNTIAAPLNGASNTTTTNLAFLLKTVTVAISFFTARIKVYPMTLVRAPVTCVDYGTPSNDQTFGISASDLHIYVVYTTDSSQSYGATAKSCKYYGDTGFTYPDATLQMGRPTMGRIKFNTHAIIDQ